MHIEPPMGMRLADLSDRNIAELLKQNNEAEDSIRIEIDDEIQGKLIQ